MPTSIMNAKERDPLAALHGVEIQQSTICLVQQIMHALRGIIRLGMS